MFFSVVIPVYNKRPHIHRAIASVLNQTYTDFELLIIDDASTDGSKAEIENFSDSRIRKFSRAEPGPGGYAARNLGIREARSEWIAFLDADDQWNPEFLETIADLIQFFPRVHCCCAHYDSMEVNGKKYEWPYGKKYKKNGKHVIGFLTYMKETCARRSPLWTSVVVVRKELFRRVGMFPEGRCRRGGDSDLWLRIVRNTDVAWSPYIGATYYRNSVNMVTHTVKKCMEHCIDSTIGDFLLSSWNSKNYVEYYWLLRLKNHYKRGAVKDKIRGGELSLNDLSALSFFGNPFRYCFYFLVVMFPGCIIRGMIRIFRRIKRAFSKHEK
ncbi:glycosyl transferase family 2 [Sediminispirochaeta smaragdinae DSM 11293]|uniref:Glycosyl transferase family 2 n=1 Tax=Sediminispirochaeta smaragdinae (strain DSM 11293 / JCM 15392 / SEBR 4228) TaxID=573413 RepID=E1RA11_SEDSS|nr:glycosyl transferase family 2 [Sediminispirochaeta smaragdinae DSM 11293]